MVTKRTRSITSRESLKFLEERLEGFDHLVPKWGNHKKTPRTKDTYQITIDKMSHSLLNSLLEDERVNDAYFCPSMPPSGMGYGVDLRFRLYIKYNKVEVKSRRKS